MDTIELTAIVDPLPGRELPFGASVGLRAGLAMVFAVSLVALWLAPRRKAPRLRLVHPAPATKPVTRAA